MGDRRARSREQLDLGLIDEHRVRDHRLGPEQPALGELGDGMPAVRRDPCAPRAVGQQALASHERGQLVLGLGDVRHDPAAGGSRAPDDLLEEGRRDGVGRVGRDAELDERTRLARDARASRASRRSAIATASSLAAAEHLERDHRPQAELARRSHRRAG